MPTLPLQRFQAGPRPAPRRVTALDLGAGVAEARQQRASVIPQAVAEASEQILSAREGARASRALSQAQLDLEQLRDSFRDDPDEATHEERYEQAAQQIRQKHSEPLFGPWRSDFEDRYSELSGRALLQIRDGVRTRRIQAGRADTDAAVSMDADLYARAQDDEERAAVLARGAETIGRAQGAGLYSPEQAQAALERFKAQATEGLWRSGMNSDPQGTLVDLMRRQGGFEHMDEVRRQVAISQVRNAYEEQLAERRAQRAEERAAAERAERDADDAADQTALDLLSGGDLPALQRHLAATRGVLSRERRQFYLDRIARGGGISDAPGGDSKTNPGAYVDLSNRAADGNLARGEIDEAFKGGLISKADRDRLVEDASDRRFQGAERLLGDSLQQSPFRFDTKTQVRNAEAKRAFAEFRATHPEASETEALEYARSLIRYTGLQDLASNPPPRFGAPAPGGQIDATAATAAAMQAFETGQITEDELDAELQRIEAAEDAQKRAGAAK